MVQLLRLLAGGGEIDRRRRVTLALVLALLAAMALYVGTHLRVRTDVIAFLPAGADATLASVSKHLSDSELARTVVLTVGADDVDTAVAGAAKIAAALRDDPDVAWVRDGVDPEQLADFQALYFPRRYSFLSDDPAVEMPRLLDDASLARRARALKRALAGPRSALVARIAAADPLMAFPSLLERMRPDASGLALHDGHFVTAPASAPPSASGTGSASPEPVFAVVFFGTQISAFDAAGQRRVQQRLSRWVADARAELGGGLFVEQSGVGRFSAQIEASMLRDVRRIAAASACGVTLLFALFFGSLRSIAIVLLPAVAGMLFAATAGLLVFGSLNGLSVAFGLSLAGVSIDYSIHLLNHLALSSGEVPAIVRRLRPSLLLGGLTTIASLAGVAFSNFPGFHQLGLLAAAAVGSALAVALVAVPALAGTPRPPRLSVRLAALLGRRLVAPRRRRVPLLLAAGVVLAGTACLFRLQWVDDLRELATLDAGLLQEEKRVRARVAHFEANRFALVTAPDWEAAVAANDRLYRALAGQVEAGALDDFRSLHSFLWSGALQRENERRLRADATLPARLADAYTAAGFRPDAFRPFADTLAADPPEPLTLEDLRASGVRDLVRPLAAQVGERCAVFTFLLGIRDEGAVRAAVEGVPGATFFDQRRFVRKVYREYRRRTVIVLVSGCFAVFGLLWLRYRRLRESLAAFLPSLLVAFLLAALAAVLGVRVTLFHLIGLVLVMGMGVDYGIFVVDGRERPGDRGVTLLSLLLSCLTTIFLFGTLALSEHPVLRALGATSALGVALAFALAPLAILVLEDAGQARAGAEP